MTQEVDDMGKKKKGGRMKFPILSLLGVLQLVTDGKSDAYNEI